MGISYYNGSGCADPTAHLAIRHLEEEEKTIHIQYPTGHMDIRMDKFFPCTVEKARKLFKLICTYCPVEERVRLYHYLQDKHSRVKERSKVLWDKQYVCQDKKKRAELLSQYKEAARTADRLQRNIAMLEYREAKTR